MSNGGDYFEESHFQELKPDDLRRFHGTKLQAKRVDMASPVRIKGDLERREQMELHLEAMVEDRLRRAAAKAHEIEEEAQVQAEAILNEARDKARQFVQEASDQREAIRMQAYQEGHNAGFQVGHQEAVAQVETHTVRLLQGVQTLAENAFAVEKQVLENFQNNALEIIRTVTEKVLAKKLSESPDVLLGMIHEAIEALYLSGKVRVVVSEETLQSIRAFTANSAEALAATTRYEWVGDPALSLHEIYVLGESSSYCLTPSVQADKLLLPLENQLPLSGVQEQVAGETHYQLPQDPIQAGEPLPDGDWPPSYDNSPGEG